MDTSPPIFLNEPKFLTPHQLVERYGNRITVRTLANWRSAGTSPPYIKAGLSIREVADLLGHAQTATTLTYIHSMGSNTADIASKSMRMYAEQK